MFLRFVVASRHRGSGSPAGLFASLYALERQGLLADYELAWFHAEEAWFRAHLIAPRRKGLSNHAVFWFRSSATECVARMRALAELLRDRDTPVDELQTTRPGRIVYEDRLQVAAVPFGGSDAPRAI